MLYFGIRKEALVRAMTSRFLVLNLATIVGFACLAIPAAAQTAHDPRLTIKPEDVKWPPAAAGAAGTSGVSAIQTVVLKGDPSKAGLYTLLLKVSQPNVRIQAHAHSDDRVATVIKGTWYFAYGDKFDEARLAALSPGSVYTEPPNVNHFAMTKGEVIIQITGIGPSTTKYVDPASDPTAKR
jgi:quercetin dioxygenase-like cupin family protein